MNKHLLRTVNYRAHITKDTFKTFIQLNQVPVTSLLEKDIPGPEELKNPQWPTVNQHDWLSKA